MRTTSKGLSYQVDLIPDEDGGYTVVGPALPGCISYGESVEHATRNAREAIELHLANLAAHNVRRSSVAVAHLLPRISSVG